MSGDIPTYDPLVVGAIWHDGVELKLSQGATMADSDVTRFRSFAERYLIERTRNTPVTGKDPKADGWTAIQDAVELYKHIYRVAVQNFEPQPQQGGVTQGPPINSKNWTG